MRTTVTLDPDVQALLDRRMRETRATFKQALNDAVRAGLARPREEAFRTPTYRLGRASVSLDRALQLAGALEDQELVTKLDLGK